MNIVKITSQLRARQKTIAAERDKLRAMLDDVQQVHDDADEAIQYIENAIDALSRLQ